MEEERKEGRKKERAATDVLWSIQGRSLKNITINFPWQGRNTERLLF